MASTDSAAAAAAAAAAACGAARKRRRGRRQRRGRRRGGGGGGDSDGCVCGVTIVQSTRRVRAVTIGAHGDAAPLAASPPHDRRFVVFFARWRTANVRLDAFWRCRAAMSKRVVRVVGAVYRGKDDNEQTEIFSSR